MNRTLFTAILMVSIITFGQSTPTSAPVQSSAPVVAAVSAATPATSTGPSSAPASQNEIIGKLMPITSFFQSNSERFKAECFLTTTTTSSPLFSLKTKITNKDIKSGKQLLTELDNLLIKKPESVQSETQLAEYEYFSTNREMTKKIITEFNANYIARDSIDTAIRFLTRNEEVIPTIAPIYSDSVYNTLRTSAKERASLMLESVILPNLKNVCKNVDANKYKHFTLQITYGSKDFSEENNLTLRGEYLAIIIPINKCLDFMAGTITQEEMVDGSDFYISDRDMTEGIKKVKLEIK